MVIRLFLLTCLIGIGTSSIDQTAKASGFVETPSPRDAILDWNSSSDSLQAMLYRAFELFAEQEPSLDSDSTGFTRAGFQFLLQDERTAIMCESLSEEDITRYRCRFQLTHPELKWSAARSSVQTRLYKSMMALKRVQGENGVMPELRYHAGLETIRLADSETASSIVCQKKRAETRPLRHEYRCYIDLRP